MERASTLFSEASAPKVVGGETSLELYTATNENMGDGSRTGSRTYRCDQAACSCEGGHIIGRTKEEHFEARARQMILRSVYAVNSIRSLFR